MKQIILIIFSIFLASPAIAGWMAHADFSSCPRKYLPNTSGTEGPFSSESACQARVSQAQREMNLTCARYSCVEAGGSASGTSSGGGPMDKHIGDAMAAGMNGQISGADAVGLMGLGILGNAILAPKAPESPEQAAARRENERIWAEQQQRQALEAQMKEAAYQMEQDSKSMALLDIAALQFQQQSSAAPAAKPVEVSQAFSRGFEHASSCISQNSAAACAGSPSPTCLSDYKAGFDAGAKKFKLIMDEAFQEGKRAGANGELANGAASKNSEGPCRYEWIQQYNRGHWLGRSPPKSK